MGFSYKRWSSRPLKLNHYLWKLKKILLSVKIWKMFDESSILINIDEAKFSNKQRQIIIRVKEDAHQIALQLSLDGQYCQRNIVEWSKHYRNQSWHYQLKSIYRIHQQPAQNMRQTINLKEERLCLILDNSPIHLYKDVGDYFIRRMCSWIYLPPYTPEFAPVELFFLSIKKTNFDCKNENNTLLISNWNNIKILRF